MTPPVAVAVVSTNLRDLLAATLRSLEPEFRAGRAEVWVVDNASEDGSPEMVERDFPWVSLIASPENVGYGAAVNLVAERTDNPWIAPANEDIELTPGALEQLLATAEAHPEAAIVAPRLVLPDGSTQHSVHSFPTLRVTLAANLGLAQASARLADRMCLPGRWDSTRPREVPWAIATFMIVRREAFDAAGGFDREQWMHAEDLDLGWRVRRAGWTIRYEPAALVRHEGSAASRKAFSEDLMTRYMAASYSWMARRRGVANAWAVAVVNFAGAAVRYLFFAPLARLGPGRFRAARDRARYWVGVHRTGLRTRAALLRPH